MKALVLKDVKNLVLEDVPDPKPTGDQVLVEVDVCGLCGTDVHMWAGTNFEGTFPFIAGHEMVGRVVAVGSDTRKIKVGDRVTGEPFIGCRTCDVCRDGGIAAFCPNHRYYGFTENTSGAFAQYHCTPEERLFVVPDSIPDEVAALTEPISVAYSAVWQRAGGVGPHDRIGIFGAGPIGLFAMATCLVAQADVIVVEPAPYRQQMARDMGATTVLDPSKGDVVKEIMELTHGRGFSKIIECSGSTSGTAMSIDVISVDGIIVLTGQSLGTKVPMEVGKAIWTHASIIGSCGSSYFFPKTIAFMSKGLVDFGKAVSHRYSLEQGEEAFIIGNKGTDSAKIMIYPDADRMNGK